MKFMTIDEIYDLNGIHQFDESHTFDDIQLINVTINPDRLH